MPNTQGFEVVAEVTVDVVRNILREAWKSGGDDSGEGVIPEYISIPPGLAFGPYQVKDGFVQIPQDQLDLNMNTVINGVDVKLGTIIHVEIDNPPIDAAKFFDMTADIVLSTPVDTIGDTKNVGIILSGLPADAIAITITSGDPIGPITNAAIAEYVHNLYRENGAAFPHTFDDIPISFPPFSMKLFVELFDDESNAAKRISVERPAPDKIKIKIPAHLRFYEIAGSYGGFTLESPMGVSATIELLADYEELSDRVIAHLGTAEVSLEDVAPWPGEEGSNYTANKNLLAIGGYDLEQIIKDGFVAGMGAQLHAMFSPDPEVFVPTVAQIENFIEEQVRAEMEARKQILVWQPEPPEGTDVSITDVTPKALGDAMAIGINAGSGANADALINFIPADRDFATAVSESKVMEAIDNAIDEEFPDGFPHRFNDVNGHDADLKSLNISLRPGAIHMKGEVTVIDAILWSIDVDADFSANAGLEWQDGPEGGQIIHPFTIGDPDVDLSLLAWIISFLIGFITVGLVGGIIALVVVAIAEGIAERIGGKIIRDEITEELKGIEAWPQTLDNIGTIEARFLNPIEIDPGGILVSGTLLITSTYALTLVDAADSHGPYTGNGGSPMSFNGNIPLPDTNAFWDFDDGNNAIIRDPVHIYGDSGVYIAKLRVAVNQEGGATTRHFAKVTIKNVAATVTLGPDITVNEGQEFEVVGHFTDPEWLDTHKARFDFGDNTKPVEGIVTETNAPPRAEGEARAKHAYCDNGTYTVNLTVEDDDGGIGIAAMKVTVKNVAPTVSLPEKLCVLVGQTVRLQASFIDPGWCDTHTAEWNFGDCNAREATIEETNDPPQAQGTAEASHVYECCGDFQAGIRVKDDDGGVGEGTMLVHAVQLCNPSMENGFRLIQTESRLAGKVANEWEAFFAPILTLDGKALDVPKEAEFLADEFVCRDGRRAQHINIRGAVQAGIYQSICANAGWDYEFTAFYHLPGNVSGKARIGIDPSGGTDPSSAEISWVEADSSSVWRNLSVRTTAKSDHITVFLGVSDRHGGRNSIYWDRAALFFIQPFCPEEVCKPACIDFAELQAGIIYKEPFTHQQLTFTPLGDQVRTALIGDPSSQVKLAFPSKGVRVDFPEPVDEVKLTVNNYAGRTLNFIAYDGDTVLNAFTEIVDNEVKTLTISETHMTAIEISGGKNEAAIVEICLCMPEPKEKCEPDCVDFTELKPGITFSKPFVHQQLTFTPLGKQIHTGKLGDPRDQVKLIFPRQGVRVDFPGPVEEVALTVNNYAGRTLEFTVYDGISVLSTAAEIVFNEVKTFTFKETHMTAIEVRGGDNEASIIEACLCLPDPEEQTPNQINPSQNSGDNDGG